MNKKLILSLIIILVFGVSVGFLVFKSAEPKLNENEDVDPKNATQNYVQVKVSRVLRENGEVEYHYRIVNLHPTRRVHTLIVGADYSSGGSSELTELPVGFDFGTAPVLGDVGGYGVPSTGVSSPEHWVPSITTEEEVNEVQLRWHSMDTAASIPPLGRRGGFSVVLARDNSAYRVGHWTAVLADGFVQSGELVLDDNPSEPDI